MEEAKETHKCLRIAAGIFTHVRVSLIQMFSGTSQLLTLSINTNI